jgi:hypothetical protein
MDDRPLVSDFEAAPWAGEGFHTLPWYLKAHLKQKLMG